MTPKESDSPDAINYATYANIGGFHGDTAKNDGWIPVEKEQPEEDGFYIATMDGKIVGQEEPFVGLAEFENGKWIDDEEDYKCVIAWRPMPEVYRPERSEGK